MNSVQSNRLQLNALRLNAWGGGAKASAPTWEKISISGYSQILLEDAMENGILSLTLQGGAKQNGTPSPTSQKSIVCNRGAISYGVIGNNLLDVKAERIVNGKYINNSGEEVSSAANFYIAQFIKVKASATYTASFNGVGYFSYMEYDSSFNFLKRTLYGESGKKITTATHTMQSNTAYVVVGSNPTSAQISEDDILKYKWMLNEGASAKPFEAYKAGFTYASADTIEIEENGATAIAEALMSVGKYVDEQEILKGSVIRRVGIKVFDGTERLSLSSGTFNYGIPDKLKSAYQVLCSHYPFTSASSANAADKTIKSYASQNIGFKDSSFATTADLSAFMAKQYAKGTPVVVVYALQDEVTEAVNPQAMPNQMGDVNITRTTAIADLAMTAVYKKNIITIPKGYEALVDENGYTLVDAKGQIIIVPKGEDSGDNDAPSGNNIIKFTVNGEEEFTAEEGMTWYDWCQSEYNKYDWTCDSLSDSVYTWKDYQSQWEYEYFMVMYNGELVSGSDTIIPNGNYQEYEDSMHLGGGGF